MKINKYIPGVLLILFSILWNNCAISEKNTNCAISEKIKIGI